jgi:hypothetical protein
VSKKVSEIVIKLLEDRPKNRGSKISDEDLRRLAKFAKENIELMKLSGCFKYNGEEIFWKTNCLGGYIQE